MRAAKAKTCGGGMQDHWRADGTDQFANNGSLGINSINPGTASPVHFTRDNGGTLISMRRTTGTYYYLYDGQGSVVGVTNPTGTALANSYEYTPYGGRLTAVETVTNPWQYNAGYTTTNGTTYKYGTRWYDATNGRWTQMDPAGAEMNPYAFVTGDPINMSDPCRDECGEDWNVGGLVHCGSKADDGITEATDAVIEDPLRYAPDVLAGALVSEQFAKAAAVAGPGWAVAGGIGGCAIGVSSLGVGCPWPAGLMPLRIDSRCDTVLEHGDHSCCPSR